MDASMAQAKDQNREDMARKRLKRHLKLTENYFKNYDPKQIDLDNIYEQIDTNSAVKLRPSNITKEEAHTVTNIDYADQKQTSIRHVVKRNTDLVSKKNTFDDNSLPMDEFLALDANWKRWSSKHQEGQHLHDLGLNFSVDQMLHAKHLQEQEKKKEARHALKKEQLPMSLEQMFDDNKVSSRVNSPKGSGRTWNVGVKQNMTINKKAKVINQITVPYTDIQVKRSNGNSTKFKKRAQPPSMGASAILSQIREDENQEKEYQEIEALQNINSHTFGAQHN